MYEHMYECMCINIHTYLNRKTYRVYVYICIYIYVHRQMYTRAHSWGCVHRSATASLPKLSLLSTLSPVPGNTKLG